MPVFLFPPAADLLDEAARRLLDQHRERLPDLTTVTVLLPSAPAIALLRQRLARRAGRGLLGPRIWTLAGFAADRATGERPVSGLECRLLLTEALKRYRNLFPGQDDAHVADALFALFEELAAHDVDPGADEAAFGARLQQAYAAPGAASRPLAWLSREAQIVHTLWRAFLEDTGGRSPAALYQRRLRAAFAALDAHEHIYLLGFDEFSRSEATVVMSAVRAGRAELWLQGRRGGHDGSALMALCETLGVQPEPIRVDVVRDGDARSRLLDAAFGAAAAAPEPRPTGVALRMVEASGPEHEARCVDLAVREALLAGARSVAVLTQDRRLARRLRALLERASVPLDDHAGWALSTSSAAAALNSWLDGIETGFQFRPLLELLKSAFMEADPPALQRLEQEVIYRRGLEGGLDELRAAASDSAVTDLLERVQSAAFSLPRPGTPWPARRWTDTLIEALKKLGLWETLQRDEAGTRLARLLEQLRAASARLPLPLTWEEFRDLLGRAIERETFVPEQRQGPVRLLTLEQSHNLRCDVLIVAGASRERLPGAPGQDPFFNQSVRAELGLPAWPQRQALALARLRRVLECAPQAWITYSADDAGEPAQLSPWLEAVETQAAVWGLKLRDPALARQAGTRDVEIADDAPGASPALPMHAGTARPAPPAPRDLLPAELSATAHQALLDCPYRFFAQNLLGLRAEQAPDEDPDRSAYGKRVHLILQAFTEPVAGLPPPFGVRVTDANREAARARLEELAQAVFGPDLRARALAQTWLAEFRGAIPALLDWLAERPALREVRAEIRLERELEGVRLIGWADRLETRPDGTRAVIDYKTGRVPGAADVESGEAVQLLHYALLDPGVAAAEYVALRPGEAGVELDEGLAALRERTGQRLRSLLRRLQSGTPLPAQGDDGVCDTCEYRGLCRRDDWTP